MLLHYRGMYDIGILRISILQPNSNHQWSIAVRACNFNAHCDVQITYAVPNNLHESRKLL